MTNTNKTEEAIKEFGQRELGDIKVLMIEDDAFFSELILSKLSEKGCVPYSAKDGEEAVDMARQYHPHLIILDLMLPGIQGEDVLKRLKEDVELKEVPVIVFSNKSEQKDIDYALSLGATKYLVKSSTDLDDFIKTVQETVKKGA